MTVPTTPESDARRLLSSTDAAHRLGFQRISDLDMWAAKNKVRAVESPTGCLRWRQGDLDAVLSPNAYPGAETSEENGDGVVLFLLGSIALIGLAAAYVIWRWLS